jgi:hypothetical protein
MQTHKTIRTFPLFTFAVGSSIRVSQLLLEAAAKSSAAGA